MLYDYCRERDIPHRRISKLVVATSKGQDSKLYEIFERATQNGVTGLRWISGNEAQRLEPNLCCTSAFLSETTGIVDSHKLMSSMLNDARESGTQVAYLTPVTGTKIIDKSRFLAETTDMNIACRTLINSAGVWAQSLASGMEHFNRSLVPPLGLAKGRYYTLSGPSPFSRLIYPCPGGESLGIHVTLDVEGNMRFGPDVEWLDSSQISLESTLDYSIEFSDNKEHNHIKNVYASISSYYPDLKDNSLTMSYTGIRAKVQREGQPVQDFVIQGPRDHGVPGLVNLFGIESPGLTSCLSIAEYVDRILKE